MMPKVNDATELAADEDVLDVKGAMALLKLGRNRVYQLCAANKIPHRRIGGVDGRRGEIRFSRAALLKWLEGDGTRAEEPAR